MEVNSYQKAIARKIGSTFKYASECGYDICEFTHAWLESNVCTRIFHENPIDLAQWAPYQLDSLLIELKEQGKSISKSDINLPDEMYWLGYTLTYWGFQDKLTGKELSQCDVVWLINLYDVLHTTSTEYAIDNIKEHFFQKSEERE